MGAAGSVETKREFPSFRILDSLRGPAVVALAYYLGCRVGFSLRFPPATTSVLWPPNSILTAAFLLLPVRQWWMCLAFLFPAHLLVELQAGLPLGLVLVLYGTNAGEGLLAASLIRSLSDAPTRFDSLRRAFALIASAVVISPFVTSFFDAAAVSFYRGEPYWAVWGRRLPSNALAGLAVVPAVVSAATVGWVWLKTAALRRQAEATALIVALATMGWMVFAGAAESKLILPGAPYTSLSFLLPLLLWAAVRFGTAAASLTLLATVLVASWAATQSQHPLGTLTSADGPFGLQVFLLVVGIPLMLVAALVEEKRRVEHALRENLTFERMLSEISGTFVHAGSDHLDTAFERALARIGESLPAERVVLSRVEASGELSWSSDADSRPRHEVALTEPLVVNGRPLGELKVVAGSSGGPAGDFTSRLRLVAAVLANALAREGAERESRRNRDELAHSLRVSTLGVLAGSLAHELNQPLGAIMANAETALARVQEGLASREELLEILADVVEDDQRAGDVIDRIRSMVRKDESRQVAVDVNALVEDVSRLLGGDAVARDVALRIHLDPRAPVILGDRVQIQQVLVNLLLNAIEATASSAGGSREVFIRTSIVEDDVVVRVEDRGPGLRAEDESRIFEPFYSTKPQGMGMGLSISMSIVQAHGGLLRGSNGLSGGAIFTFALPLAASAPAESSNE